MVAVTQHLEDKKKHTPDVAGDLSKAHTGLMRQLWTRSLLTETLKDCTYKLIEKGGRICIEVVPPVAKDVTPWHLTPSEGRVFKLFSTNKKMKCPTWDLPSGVNSTGGSCPAAVYGQTTALGRSLAAETGDVLVSNAAFSLLLNVREAEWNAMREYQRANGLPEAEPFRRSLKLQDAVCNYCVAGETLVLVRGHGLKRVDELVSLPEFEVWSGIDWRKTRAVLTKYAPLVEVRFNGGRSLRCTADHRIITTDGEVEAQHLVPGEHQVAPAMPSDAGASWDATSRLTVESVESCGELLEPVYDLLNVGEEQQFIANGIPVHNCYASSGKYGETSTQLGELVRYGWVKSMLATSPQALEDTIFRTIHETQLEGEKPERFPYRFIRVHSSGDFYSSEYAAVWLKVAWRLWEAEQKGELNRRRPVRLWAPTRTHVQRDMQKFWRDNKVPPNFSIRASAYAIGDPAPFVHLPSPTGCKGSSVLSEADTKELRKRPGEKFDWQCGVYDLGKGDKTCLEAKAPDGRKGCRACWLRPDLAVNYAQH